MALAKILAALILLNVPLTVAARESPAPAQSFREAASVVVVEVPVNVVLDGQPVRGLVAENFRVFDGGKEQPLAGFQAIDLELTAGTARAVPLPARRRFLLFFDLAFTPRADLSRGLAAARELLGGLHPADLVALGVYTRDSGAELLLNFTTDRGQVGKGLDGLADLLDGKPKRASAGGKEGDPLRLVVDHAMDLVLDVASHDLYGEEAVEQPHSFSWREPDLARDNLKDIAKPVVERDRDRVRGYFRAMSEALAEFAAATTGDGRRFFVFFSRGFDGSIFDARQGLEAPSTGGGTSARTSLGRAIEEFRRAGWEVHSIDPRRQEGHQADSLQSVDNLQSMAQDTGGSLYRYFGNLGSAMGEMLERTGVTYLLAFQIENVRQDAHHPIRVELKAVPGRDELGGAKVLHRAGFHAPDPAASGIAKVVGTAERLLSAEESGDLPLDVLLLPLRDSGGSVRLAVLLETTGEALLAGAEGAADLGVEVYAYAIDEKGEVADFLGQQVTLDVARVGEEMLAGKSFALFSDLSLEPGSYRLRVLIRQRQSGREVLKTVPFEVPDLEGDDPSLSALMMAAQDEPLLIRENARLGAAPYPFVVGDGQEFFPELAPVLDPRTTRRLVLFGYGLQDDAYRLAIELKKASGEKVDGHLKLVGAAPTEQDGLDRLYLLLDPAGLPPGAYRLEAVIAAADGRPVGSKSLDLRVGS